MKALTILSPPAFGLPCNGCGECCRREVCKIGLAAFGDVAAPCPALVERDGRTWCGVVLEAELANVAFGAHMRFVLGVGRGCDSEFDVSGETEGSRDAAS